MSFATAILMASSILLPAVTGIIRYRHLHRHDRLFVLLLCMGCINEGISIAAVLCYGSNAFTFNAYVLVESLVMLVIFLRWDPSAKPPGMIVAAILLVTVWLLDNFYNRNYNNFYGLFGLLCSVIMMYYAVKQISRHIAFDSGALFNNGRFLVSLGILLYFSVKAITDAFFIADLLMSPALAANIVFICSITNVFCNLVFTYAILCLNKRATFTLEYC